MRITHISSLALVLASAAAAPAQDCLQWGQRLPAASPSGRTGHGLAYDAARNKTLLFGGSSIAGFLGDTWQWDGTSWIQLFPSNSPSPRYGTGMVYDGARQRIVLFGGSAASGHSRETWEWDGSNWLLRSSNTGPTARRWPGMAYDPMREQTVLFGGFSTSPQLDDTWEWDGSAWSQKFPALSPQSRRGHAMSWNGSRVSMFGGSDGGAQVYSDHWEWDGVSWVQRVTLPPFGGNGIGMAYNAGRGTLVRAPAEDGVTWEWTGVTWLPRQVPSLGRRDFTPMAYDAVRARMVVFGGASTTTAESSETWELAPVGNPPVINTHPASQNVGIGGSAVLTVVAGGAGPLAYQWRRNGVPLADGGYVLGSTTSTLTLSPVSMADTASYNCVVSQLGCSVVSNYATVTVTSQTCYPNCDGSTATPILNVADFTCFLQRFAAGCP